MQHIVKTCRAIEPDPSSLPTIPKGTFGIAETEESCFARVNFGPPWGVQDVESADLLDAAAVLGNAKRAITYLKRPWRNVLQRTLKSFAGSYLSAAAAARGYHGEFGVEAYMYQRGARKGALALLDEAIALTGRGPAAKETP